MEESKPENKKAKLETAAIDKNVYSKILQTFRLVGVLSEDAYQKSIYVHGKVVVDSQLGGSIVEISQFFMDIFYKNYF